MKSHHCCSKMVLPTLIPPGGPQIGLGEAPENSVERGGAVGQGDSRSG